MKCSFHYSYGHEGFAEMSNVVFVDPTHPHTLTNGLT